jgi:hypothetical protein
MTKSSSPVQGADFQVRNLAANGLTAPAESFAPESVNLTRFPRKT